MRIWETQKTLTEQRKKTALQRLAAIEAHANHFAGFVSNNEVSVGVFTSSPPPVSTFLKLMYTQIYIVFGTRNASCILEINFGGNEQCVRMSSYANTLPRSISLLMVYDIVFLEQTQKGFQQCISSLCLFGQFLIWMGLDKITSPSTRPCLVYCNSRSLYPTTSWILLLNFNVSSGWLQLAILGYSTTMAGICIMLTALSCYPVWRRSHQMETLKECQLGSGWIK